MLISFQNKHYFLFHWPIFKLIFKIILFFLLFCKFLNFWRNRAWGSAKLNWQFLKSGLCKYRIVFKVFFKNLNLFFFPWFPFLLLVTYLWWVGAPSVKLFLLLVILLSLQYIQCVFLAMFPYFPDKLSKHFHPKFVG